jgi:glycosyltransferase involved in cell wall biosynthesis
MRILWFTNTSSLYSENSNSYNGGGWIESLEFILRSNSSVDLAVSFFHHSDNRILKKNRVSYFPVKKISPRKNPVEYLINRFRRYIVGDNQTTKFLEVIELFKPDVIHIFGTEGPFCEIVQLTKIPVLIHIQGIINPNKIAYFPPGYSKVDFFLSRIFLFKNVLLISPFFSYLRLKKMCLLEEKALKNGSYACGRSEWDSQVVKFYNPKITYFHIDEVLRPVFYRNKIDNNIKSKDKFVILSTLSNTIYKGLDVVLKVAHLLKKNSNLNFEWRIIGLDVNSDLFRFFENRQDINHSDVNIKLLGVLNSEQIYVNMIESNVFVHTSYIDNSPNSVCEAQIVGLPTIASNVGGVSSLISHNSDGILVPANGVYEYVSYIKKFYSDPCFADLISRNGRITAKKRHDKKIILNKLLNTYSEIS